MQVFGPSKFKVQDLKADVENVIFTFKVFFDLLSFQAKYQIDARILLLTLTGQGDLTGTFRKIIFKNTCNTVFFVPEIYSKKSNAA